MKKRFIKNLNRTRLASALLPLMFSGAGFANVFGDEAPAIARTQAQAAFGSFKNQFLGDLDSMMPVLKGAHAFGYLNGTGRISSEQDFYIGPGIGGRAIVRDQQMIGAYGFVDYQQTHPYTHQWVINPGVEWMSRRFDAHLNGYWPSKTFSPTANARPAADFGVTQHQYFEGHGAFDTLYQQGIILGRGFDGQVGVLFNPKENLRGRIAVGGYSYHAPETLYQGKQTTKGLTGTIQLPLRQNWDVLFTDSYDNVNKNQVALTLRATFDGNNRYPTHIQDRLLDRVERHIGIISTGAALPYQQGVVNTQVQTMTSANNWFFVPYGATLMPNTLLPTFAPEPSITFESCTLEHPCVGIDQMTVDAINALQANANLYLSSGEYILSNTNEILSLPAGQSMYGRTSGFGQAAQGLERPLLDGAITLNGGHRFENLRLLNDTGITVTDPRFASGSTQAVGLYIPGDVLDPIEIINSDIRTELGGSAPLLNAIAMFGGELHLRQSTLSVDALNGTGSGRARGLSVYNGGQVEMEASSVNAISHFTGIIQAMLIVRNDSSAVVNQSQISAINTGEGEARGVHVSDGAGVTINESSISALAKGVGIAYGVFTANQNTNTVLNNSQVNSRNTSLGEARGFQAQSDAILTANNVHLIVEAGTGIASGVLTFSNGQVGFYNGIIDVSGANPGNVIQAGSNIVITGSTCTLNGGVVSCS